MCNSLVRISALLFVLLLISCESLRTGVDGEMVRLSFDRPVIMASVDSRAVVSGDNFPNSHEPYSIGFWLMRNDKDVPQIDGFDNMRSSYSVVGGEGRWLFYPFRDNESRESINIRKGLPVDIYAYYPWVEEEKWDGEVSLTAVPFVSGQDDWMVAGPVSLNEGQTLKDNVVTLPFQHIMTCLQISIRCKYTGSIVLTSMTLTDTTEEPRLVAEGVFNCKTKEISGDKVNSITVKPQLSISGGNVAHAYIIMPEVDDIGPDEMTLSFVFNNIEAETVFTIPDQMKFADGSIRTIDRFAKGYKYVYNLELDNTMKFVPVGVETTPTTVNVEMPI